MSFSLSRKTSVKINDKNKAPEQPAKQKGFGTKQNPILTAKTEEYVDDTNLYPPIINAADRLRYFEFLLAHWKPKRRDTTKGNSWIAEKIKETNDELNYPPFYVHLFRIVRSQRWDQLYLNCFMVFLILSVIFFDGIAKSMLPALDAMRDTLLMIPLIFMLVSASVPCFGTAWFVHYGYDLVHYCASKDFLHWVRPTHPPTPAFPRPPHSGVLFSRECLPMPNVLRDATGVFFGADGPVCRILLLFGARPEGQDLQHAHRP